MLHFWKHQNKILVCPFKLLIFLYCYYAVKMHLIESNMNLIEWNIGQGESKWCVCKLNGSLQIIQHVVWLIFKWTPPSSEKKKTLLKNSGKIDKQVFFAPWLILHKRKHMQNKYLRNSTNVEKKKNIKVTPWESLEEQARRTKHFHRNKNVKTTCIKKYFSLNIAEQVS